MRVLNLADALSRLTLSPLTRVGMPRIASLREIRPPMPRVRESASRGWRRVGPPRPPRRRHFVTRAFGAEDGWGDPATGPASADSNK